MFEGEKGQSEEEEKKFCEERRIVSGTVVVRQTCGKHKRPHVSYMVPFFTAIFSSMPRLHKKRTKARKTLASFEGVYCVPTADWGRHGRNRRIWCLFFGVHCPFSADTFYFEWFLCEENHESWGQYTITPPFSRFIWGSFALRNSSEGRPTRKGVPFGGAFVRPVECRWPDRAVVYCAVFCDIEFVSIPERMREKFVYLRMGMNLVAADQGIECCIMEYRHLQLIYRIYAWYGISFWEKSPSRFRWTMVAEGDSSWR